MTAVVATVRLQFHREFTFDDALPLVSYFKRLGISHIYSSPILKARPGSNHGYDLTDPTCINPELGGEEALVRLVNALHQQGMGLIVDIVSNHMAVGADNPWWTDVLTWGLHSPYAHFFDIQWNSPDPLLKGQLLLPFLESNYGEVLAAGKISLHFERDSGQFYVSHYQHRFPLNPASYAQILRLADDPDLQKLADEFANLDRADGPASASDLLRRLSELAFQTRAATALAQALSLFDVELAGTQTPDEPGPTAVQPIELAVSNPESNLARLHQLLELQPYRLASWRTAADDINWRRFFDVNELGGLRVEKPAVFEAAHRKIFELVERGWIDGLRIDHVDGLANPRAYCRKLRRRLDQLTSAAGLNKRIIIYVEKILADGEALATDWRVDGTTGYEFMNQVSLLQHDPVGELQLFDLWTRQSGRPHTFVEEVKLARQLVLSSSLAGDVETVAQGLLQIARADLATRDLTLGAIRRALIELVVHFPVYRTYALASGRRARDQQVFEQALAGARQTLAESDWPLLDYLDRWLGGEPLSSMPPGPLRTLRRKVLTRFQQLTSPAAAKAVEDTACYRSAVLLSRNDVGFDPQHFSAPLVQFHRTNAERAAHYPNNLLATATHDHKRGEDTRARLAVISERSAWFTEKAEDWQNQAASLRTILDEGPAPSPGDELILLQILLGSWPLALSPQVAQKDSNALEDYLARLLQWQEKAQREAKLRTSWAAPNEAYESASRDFLTRLLRDDATRNLRVDIAEAAMSLAVAGALNSLSQTLLKLCSPGVPDIYQGTEFWDFSLVDPDNRRPVDFATRCTTLDPERGLDELLAHWKDGRIKQWLIRQTLKVRHKYLSVFAQGDYQPLATEGEQADHLVAFVRRYQDIQIVVLAPRLGAHLLGTSSTPLIPAAAWENTAVQLPPGESLVMIDGLHTAGLHGDFTNAARDNTAEDSGNRLLMREVLAGFPLNVLVFQSSFSGDQHHAPRAPF
jgi:(1->4)-alpha-D-glucan 1-alpha-D-glucosylmutase